MKSVGSYSIVDHLIQITASVQHSEHLTGGSLRVFRRLASLEAGSSKVALSRPAHQRVMQTIRHLHGGVPITVVKGDYTPI